MAEWAEVAVDEANQPRPLDVSDMGFKNKDGTNVDSIPFITISGDEYFVLRMHKKFKDLREKLGGKFNRDLQGQALGLLACWLRFFKADPSLKADEFFALPIETQLILVSKMDKELGVDKITGGGDESPEGEQE